MSFWKKLYYWKHPEKLSLEELLLTQKSLLARLLIISREMQRRYEALSELGKPITGAQESVEYFAKETKRMNGICLILDNVLAQQAGIVPRPE